MIRKSILTFIAFLIVIFSIFIYLYSTQPLVQIIAQNAYVPKCNKYDIDLEIPDLMKTSIIKFEANIAIKNTDERIITKGCPGILQDTAEYITTSLSPKDVNNVDTRNFIVLKHVYTICQSAFESGCFAEEPGDQYLIQDLSSGNKYRINSLYFGSKGNIKAGYYNKNNPNLRLGDVEVKNWSCNNKGKCSINNY